MKKSDDHLLANQKSETDVSFVWEIEGVYKY